jgi:hypothetical protein
VGGGACLALARPWRRGALAALALVAAVAVWWARIPPRADRDWQPDVARTPRSVLAGDRLTVYDVRNFDYRSESDFEERWETRTWDLRRIEGVDVFLSSWGSPHIAHTITSWRFEGAPPLAISIETRKEKGETYSALLGFFRRFELHYVVADERDVVRLRTNVRGERARLYPIRMSPARARELLLDYLRGVNRLAAEPAWYNALTTNCTTRIRHHAQNVAAGNPWSWKILLNGHLDEMAYARGTIDTSLPFEELRARSDVTERARAADADPAFSRRIRAGIPGLPPALGAGAAAP